MAERISIADARSGMALMNENHAGPGFDILLDAEQPCTKHLVQRDEPTVSRRRLSVFGIVIAKGGPASPSAFRAPITWFLRRALPAAFAQRLELFDSNFQRTIRKPATKFAQASQCLKSASR
jgi:hypothetical protein